MTLIAAANIILSSLTVIGQIIVVLVVAAYAIRNEKLLKFFGENAVLFSFVVALTATLGSLFYSEIAGYEPCKLCWLQRIMMYPHVILLGVALWRKDKDIGTYSMALAVVGMLIAGYHYLLQIGVAPELPCSAIGYSDTCSQRFVMQFGYVTIPMMALTAFMLVIAFFLTKKGRGRSESRLV